MRDGWEVKRLGEVCDLIARGVAPNYIDAGGICVLNQKCVRDHKVNYELARRHNATTKRIDPERFLKVGDVLINSTGTGTLGRVAQVRRQPPEPTTVDTHVTIVRPQAGRFYPEFFGYMLVRIEDEIAASGEGASGQTELVRSVIENRFQVSFPTSLPEQKRIVTILDEAFAGIAAATANAEKNLANARELFEGYLASVFSGEEGGWATKRLQDICGLQNGFAFKSELFKPEGIPVLRISSIQDEQVCDNRPVFADPSDYKENLQKYLVNEGDLLIAMSGATTGKIGFNRTGRQFLLNQRVGKFQPRPQLDIKYLFYFLSTKVEENLEISAGSAQPNLSTKQINDFLIPLPPLNEQRAIVHTLERFDTETKRLKSNYQRKLTALSELKQSILQKAFSGELTALPEEALEEEAA